MAGKVFPLFGPAVKVKTWPVLYALEGDTLRICGGEAGAGRPAGFETKGTGSVLLTLRRE